MIEMRTDLIKGKRIVENLDSQEILVHGKNDNSKKEAPVPTCTHPSAYPNTPSGRATTKSGTKFRGKS